MQFGGCAGPVEDGYKERPRLTPGAERIVKVVEGRTMHCAGFSGNCEDQESLVDNSSRSIRGNP